MKKALITGITGQDGSHLADLLLEQGYEVHGFIRRSSTVNTSRIDHLINRVTLHQGDLSDYTSILSVISKVKPQEVYNLAAQSHVRVSFDTPEYTFNVTGAGPLRILSAIRDAGLEKDTRFYQASSSEMYGKVQEVPQTEKTPFYPRSPYGIAKLAAYWATVNHREGYGMHASNGILFNHEGERRGDTFVSRKITLAAARISMGLQDKLFLGNLDAKRDWGHAADYVRAMWLMLQQDRPDDYVIATGETHSIREFLDEAFGYLGMDWSRFVEIDPNLFRPAEVDLLIGDPKKAREKLGWTPQITFRDLVHGMMKHDLAALKKLVHA